MTLAETYSDLRKSIVAFIPKVFPANEDGSPPQIAPIFGTGYVIQEDGIIATNQHVVDAFKKFQNAPGADKDSWPVIAILFHMIDEGMIEIPLEVIGVGVIKTFKPGGVYYGPPKPDLAIVHVKARGLPALNVDGDAEIVEGMAVATAGYPMGSDLLTAPGWLHQLCPTLQQGIVSAVLPFSAPKPHGISLNIMIQTGASGSPVFLPDSGSVIGTVFASLGEPSRVVNITEDGTKETVGVVRVPTTFSHAVPSHYLSHFLEQMKDTPEFQPPDDAQTIEERLDGAKFINRTEEDSPYQPIYDEGDGPQLAIRKIED